MSKAEQLLGMSGWNGAHTESLVMFHANRVPTLENGDVDETSFVRVLPPKKLRVWCRAHPLPPHALQGHDAASAVFWGKA